MARCPGQDQRYWTADDIFDLRCPYCGYEIEFWKDEPFRICKGCGREIRNPRINLGCAEWCQNADACLGRSTDGDAASPIVERLAAALEQVVDNPVDDLAHARELCSRIDGMLSGFTGNPLVAKGLALIIGAGFGFNGQAVTSNGDWRQFLNRVLELSELEEEVRFDLIKALKELLHGTPVSPESQLVFKVLTS